MAIPEINKYVLNNGLLLFIDKSAQNVSKSCTAKLCETATNERGAFEHMMPSFGTEQNGPSFWYEKNLVSSTRFWYQFLVLRVYVVCHGPNTRPCCQDCWHSGLAKQVKTLKKIFIQCKYNTIAVN